MAISGTVQSLSDVSRFVLLPAIGFLAGFLAQWMLQERNSRSELVRALAEMRAQVLCKLWEITTLPADITELGNEADVPDTVRERFERSIFDWYTKQAGALYLSWPATQLVFRLLDLLRSAQTRKAHLEKAVSLLRSQLKFDCGIYSSSQARRNLVRPRPAPWSHNASM